MGILKSFYYVLQDIVLLAFVFYLDLPTPLHAITAGCLMWSLFVIGHDCGHGSFSKHRAVNDIVGHLLHGCLLVPYYPWQLSHSHHHRYHMHKDKDMSHKWSADDDVGGDYGVHSIWLLPAYLPIYLYLGMFDGSHIMPNSKLFTDQRERIECVMSTAWCLVNVAVITWYFNYNVSAIFHYYTLPWFVFVSLIYIISYLHHHDIDTTVYDSTSWTFKAGAEETIDLSYGWFFDRLFHHITDCHKIHHYRSKIPHYDLVAESKKAGYEPKHQLGNFGWLPYFYRVYSQTQTLHRQESVYKFKHNQ